MSPSGSLPSTPPRVHDFSRPRLRTDRHPTHDVTLLMVASGATTVPSGTSMRLPPPRLVIFLRSPWTISSGALYLFLFRSNLQASLLSPHTSTFALCNQSARVTAFQMAMTSAPSGDPPATNRL